MLKLKAMDLARQNISKFIGRYRNPYKLKTIKQKKDKAVLYLFVFNFSTPNSVAVLLEFRSGFM